MFSAEISSFVLRNLMLAQSAPGSESADASVQNSASAAGPFLDTLWADIRQLVTIEAVLDRIQSWGPKLLSAIAVFVIGRFCARLLTSMIMRAASKAKLDATLTGFASNVVYVMLLTTVCIAALGCLGVDTTSLSAVLAAAGFAIGMALQGSLGNIASGVLLVFFKPFRVGDFVELGGVRGKVVEIQIFSTILVTADNVRIIVPNASITNGTIQNFTAEPKRRIDLVVSCGYNDDLRAVKDYLRQVVHSDPRILADPAPVVAVSELADSGVNFVVRPWVMGTDYWDTRFDLVERVKLGFDERGFTIPFPSRDVFVHQAAPFAPQIMNEATGFAA